MIIGQRVLSNVGFGNDVGIWEGSLFMRSCILNLRRKQLSSFVARFLVVVAIFIEIPRGSYGISHGCGV